MRCTLSVRLTERRKIIDVVMENLLRLSMLHSAGPSPDNKDSFHRRVLKGFGEDPFAHHAPWPRKLLL